MSINIKGQTGPISLIKATTADLKPSVCPEPSHPLPTPSAPHFEKSQFGVATDFRRISGELKIAKGEKEIKQGLADEAKSKGEAAQGRKDIGKGVGELMRG